jgi:hypothetical protein
MRRPDPQYPLEHGECSVLSGHTTTVATTRDGQQPVVVGSHIVVTCWYVTLALPVIVALVRRVRPLLAL